MSSVRPLGEPPASLRHVAAAVEHRLAALLGAEIARWSELDPDLAAPLRSLEALVGGGGKRLRAAFCHWGWVGAGGDPDDPLIVDAGAAFELLQAFALVHDDVMDGSPTRRGRPAVHHQFMDLHHQATWRGEPRRFGEGVAILIGDLAHVYADQLLLGAGPDALLVWNELRIELNIGQFLDVLGTARADTDRSLARRIARYKSGKYTIERPLQLGATLAGRADLQKALSLYGDPLGEAFQLRDDLLGAFGDETLTGKPVGDDLREGKPTPLLAAATELASSGQRSVLGRVGEPGMTPEVVAAVQAVLHDTGAVEEMEATIHELAGNAIDALQGIDLTPEAIDALEALARYVAFRER